MKIIIRVFFSLTRIFIHPLLVKNSKKNGITLVQKLKLLLIHLYYSNYQPMSLDKWEKKSSKRNVDDRLMLIKPKLESTSILDIGSHSGYFSLKLAQEGYFVIGIDQDRVILNKANLIKEKYNINNASFLYYPLDISSAKMLPVFDNILYLSIHHHMIKVHGFKKATEIFKIIAQKVRYNLFFDFPYPDDYKGLPLFENSIPDMGDDPDKWIADYLVKVGFKNVTSLKILGHNQKPDEKRNLLMASH